MKNGLYEIFAERYGTDIYIYSDTHFSDLDSYKLRFPEKFNDSQSAEEQQAIVDELDQMQIKNCNRKCSKNSTLILLGDVGNIECVKKLKAGYKVLILGNHDVGASNYKRVLEEGVYVCPKCGSRHITIDEHIDDDNYLGMAHFEDDFECLDCGHFASYHDGESYYDNKLHHINECIKTLDNHLFDEVYEGTLQIGPKIILSHEPVDYKYCLNIHGHTHNITEPFYSEEVTFGDPMIDEEYSFNYYHYCVIGEANNYEPTSLNKLIKSGMFKDVADIHRVTIDRATERNNIDGQERETI